MKLLVLVLVFVLVVEAAVDKKKSEKKEATSAKKEDAKKKTDAKKETNVKKEDTKKKAETKKSSFSFVGKDTWGEESLKMCYKKQPLPEDYKCYVYYFNYEPVYVDPLSTNPIIIIYRRFIPKKFIDDFLYDVERKQKRKSEKKDDENFMAEYIRNFQRRIANETTVSHKSMSGVARVFRRTQALIPMLNFSNSGPWQVLSYKKGGHHSPHYDYITYSSPDQYSRTTRKNGNRFVTFALTLKAADIGGETIFVYANQTAELEAGDALLFTLINKDMTPTSPVAIYYPRGEEAPESPDSGGKPDTVEPDRKGLQESYRPPKRKRTRMVICTYNARTLVSEAAIEDLMMQAEKIKYDVIGLTETRRRHPLNAV
ncbi:hypothetical protein RB195_026463 [Necator americanus]|uniref:Prolyl 4-hydroxylase alpha subunit domain-containing protein n=1 Tax=Necator americanus TaxID=51031 RepID=A0ABR1EZ84_NECAM